MITRIILLFFLLSSISIASNHTDFGRLRYDERGLPLIDVQIVGRIHTLMLDTGSGEGIHLYKHNLEKLIADSNLKVTRQISHRLIDVSGGVNIVAAWKINTLLIANTFFNNVEAVIFKPWGLSIGGERPVNEVMGLGLFHDRRVMMDFKNHRLQMLQSLPTDISHWSAYPVEKTASGLRIIASINSTPLYLIIDTGASHSLLFSESLPANTLFSGCRTLEPEASNLDCRVTKINFSDNNNRLRDDLAIVTNEYTRHELDFDGLVGMNFMRGRKVIIDMPKSMLYISH